MKSVLLVNSDLAANRGDRAIAEGLVQAIRSRYPEARITGLSEHADRDATWFGIDFARMNVQSVSPFAYLRLLRLARRCDAVLWGGGEILKDYTNKAALWYWVAKMVGISLVNSRLYGAYQGIGPTSPGLSRRLIAAVVRRTRLFVVRDSESREKLISWGVPESKVVASSDPAVLPQPVALSDDDRRYLRDRYGVDDAFLSSFICFGPRSWFHYRRSGILPYRYVRRARRMVGLREPAPSAEYVTYRKALVALADVIVRDLGFPLLMMPMHMAEDDADLCRFIAANCARPDRVIVIGDDDLPPSLIRALMAHARVMVGFRLHSNIIATSAGVPSLNVYYVDKGRVYFDALGQRDFCLPIERTLEPDFLAEAKARIEKLLVNHAVVEADIRQAVDRLRAAVHEGFQRISDDYER